jgi:hypothetical protein
MIHTRAWSKRRAWWYCFDGAMVVCDGVAGCVDMVLLCLRESEVGGELRQQRK